MRQKSDLPHVLSPGYNDGDDGKRRSLSATRLDVLCPLGPLMVMMPWGDDVTIAVRAQRPTRQQHKDTQPVSGKVTDI